MNRKGAGTKSALETAETDFKTAKAHADAKASAVRAAEAHVREAEVAIENMHVYAPFDATVISKDAELGETIMPGGMGPAPAAVAWRRWRISGALEVDTDVKEDYLAHIRRGQPAEVLVDAVPDRRYRGRLREIIPMGDRTRGIVKVKVEVLDADERLFPELSATVHFLPEKDEKSTGDATQALFVPLSAVVKIEGAAFRLAFDGRACRAGERDSDRRAAGRSVACRGRVGRGRNSDRRPARRIDRREQGASSS